MVEGHALGVLEHLPLSPSSSSSSFSLVFFPYLSKTLIVQGEKNDENEKHRNIKNAPGTRALKHTKSVLQRTKSVLQRTSNRG
ncbi:hypothetical protein SESBI_09432 [Sesbania bispinosa]|nr:hypothetical protein SESBI_09432 [Sesbania bispinosa]